MFVAIVTRFEYVTFAATPGSMVILLEVLWQWSRFCMQHASLRMQIKTICICPFPAGSASMKVVGMDSIYVNRQLLIVR